MKLINFYHNGRPHIGQLDEGGQITFFALQDGLIGYMRRGITPQTTSERVQLSEVKVLAPYTPGKIIGVGRNYADHAKELKNDVPDKPLLFAKFPSSVIGTDEAITWHSSMATQVDYEGELAVVIGKRASNVSEEDALKHVFGYTIANDVTSRDLQESESQWVRAKGLDTFCPLGPVIVNVKEMPDASNLKIVTKLNDEVMQDGNTGDMIFSIPYLISYCSKSFILEPGDMILTGTPSGVGKAQKPPRFLKDGDVVSVSIEGIGELSNVCRVIED